MLRSPWGLTRFHHSGQSHFVTFCCYHRHRLFTTDASCRVFESALERVRRSYRLYVYGYVVMPEHVHLLLSEPQRDTLADALKSLKQGVSRRLIGSLPLKSKTGLSGAPEHFWQKRYYDFNVRNYAQFVEKLRYIHRNPVKQGLCDRPEDWYWSSFRHYATGAAGSVEIESEWTARKRERAAGKLCPAVELPHSSQKRASPPAGENRAVWGPGLEWATRLNISQQQKRPRFPEWDLSTLSRSSSDRTYLQTMLGLSLASSRHAWCSFCFRAASPTLSDPFEIVTLVTTGSTTVCGCPVPEVAVALCRRAPEGCP